MKKLKILLIIPILGLALMLFNTNANAIASSAVGDACSGVNQLSNTSPCGDTKANASTVNGTIKTAINILSIIIGVASIIVIIIAGFRFVAANGDSNTISSARTQLIYAIIGLAIVAIAQVIVRETLNTASNIGVIRSILNIGIH